MIDLTEAEGIQSDKGIWGIRLALTGAVFADLSDEDLTPQLLESFTRYLSNEGVQPSWLRNPRTEKWGKFEPHALEEHTSWLRELDNNRPFEIAVSDGESWQDAAEHFCAVVRAAGALRRLGTRSYIRFSLPRVLGQATPDAVMTFLLEIANLLHADSGWCGLGLVISPDKSIAASLMEEEFATAQRFEGIDVGSVAVTSVAAKSGIKGVNWLTILGRKWLKNLGGHEVLSQKLSDTAVVIRFENGAIVRAGEVPVLGDRNRGKPAHIYRAVGKVLAPIRVQRHGRFHKLRGGHYFGEAETQEWLARFD